MTISAPQPDPDRSERASDAVGGCANRSLPEHGGLRLVGAVERDDTRAALVARRLRTAPPAQLELVSVREGPGPEVVWASLPDRVRESVLVLLARLIGVGAVDEEGAG